MTPPRRIAIALAIVLLGAMSPSPGRAAQFGDYEIAVHSQTSNMPGIEAFRSALAAYGFRDGSRHVNLSAPLPAVYDRLDYTKSAAVDRQFRSSLEAGLSGHEPQRTQVRDTIEAGGPWQGWGKLMIDSGLSNHNLADSLAIYLAYGWVFSNGTQAAPSQSALEAVRAQLLQQPAIAAALDRLAPSQIQVASEDFMYGGFLALVTTGALSERGETDRLRIYRGTIGDDVRRQLGIDLSKLQLTDGGFVPR